MIVGEELCNGLHYYYLTCLRRSVHRFYRLSSKPQIVLQVLSYSSQHKIPTPQIDLGNEYRDDNQEGALFVTLKNGQGYAF